MHVVWGGMVVIFSGISCRRHGSMLPIYDIQMTYFDGPQLLPRPFSVIIIFEESFLTYLDQGSFSFSFSRNDRISE